MTPAERQRAYRARIAAREGRTLGDRPGPAAQLPCGTLGAWRRHQRAGEPPCDACRAARAVYVAGLRAR